MSDAFGELRSLAHRIPTRLNFASILDLLVAASETVGEDRVRAEWIPYLEGTIESWPDDARACTNELAKVLESSDTVWSSLVRTLDYSDGKLGSNRIELLAEADHLAHITRLDLRAARTNWSELEQLVDHAPFERLESFALRKSTSSGVNTRVLTKWFSSPMMTNLEELSFSGWGTFNARATQLMWECLPLGRLRHLDLSSTQIGKKQLRKLFELEDLKNLEVLDLSWLEFNAAASRALAQATHLESLRDLRLRGCMVDWEAVCSLAGATHLQHLEHLNLSQNRLRPGDLGVLVSGEPFNGLRTLSMKWNDALEGFPPWMAQHADHFPSLVSLELSDIPLNDLDALDTGELEGLRALRLDSCGGNGVHGLGELSQSEWFAQLEMVSLRNVLDQSEGPKLPNAPRYLDLSENHFSPGELVALFDDVDTSRLEVLLLDRIHEPGSYVRIISDVPELLETLDLKRLRVLSVQKSMRTDMLGAIVDDQRFPALEVLYCSGDWGRIDRFFGMRVGDSWTEEPKFEQWNSTIAAMLRE